MKAESTETINGRNITRLATYKRCVWFWTAATRTRVQQGGTGRFAVIKSKKSAKPGLPSKKVEEYLGYIDQRIGAQNWNLIF